MSPVNKDNWNYFTPPTLAPQSDGDDLPAYENRSMLSDLRENTSEKDPIRNTLPKYHSPDPAPQPNNELSAQEDDHIVLDHHLEVRGESSFRRAIRLFGNPLAHDEQWSVTMEDFNLRSLPHIDFMVMVKHSFKHVKRPGKHSRPGFDRDPSKNPKFSPEMEFEPFVIPNKIRTSKFVGSGFQPVYNGRVFAAHDVSAADWRQFLYDIAAAGSSAPGTIPLGSNLTKLYLPFSHLTGKLLQTFREESALDVIRVWQEKFFVPRGLSVAVDRGGPIMSPRSTVNYDNFDAETVRKMQKEDRKLLRQLSRDYGKVRLLVSPLAK